MPYVRIISGQGNLKVCDLRCFSKTLRQLDDDETGKGIPRQKRSSVNKDKYPTCNFSKNIDSKRVDLLPYTTRSRCRDRKRFNAAQLRYTDSKYIITVHSNGDTRLWRLDTVLPDPDELPTFARSSHTAGEQRTLSTRTI